MSALMLFKDVVRERHSVRHFLPHPVPEEILRSVLEDAQRAPSNCNTQPWQTHIVSGSKRDALSNALLAADDAGELTPDFSFDTRDFHGVYHERSKHRGRLIIRLLALNVRTSISVAMPRVETSNSLAHPI